VAGLKARLEAAVKGDSEPEATGEEAAEEPQERAAGETRRWRIELRPGPEMFREGNDPLILFRELGKLGELEVETRTPHLPTLEALDPTSCHMEWSAKLTTTVPEEEIREIFSWIGDPPKRSRQPGGRRPPGPKRKRSRVSRCRRRPRRRSAR